jgi:hypothetical protein
LSIPLCFGGIPLGCLDNLILFSLCPSGLDGLELSLTLFRGDAGIGEARETAATLFLAVEDQFRVSELHGEEFVVGGKLLGLCAKTAVLRL